MQYVSTSITAESIFFIQSATAENMREKIAQRIALQAAGASSAVSSCEIAGAGDGHTFITRLGFVDEETVDALADVVVRPYLASDERELPKARAAALVGLTGTKQDEPFAGASKGTRFMGLVVVGNRILG
jgi:hypothetical protein